MSDYYRITPTKHGWGYGYGFFSNYRICLEQLMIFHESGINGIPYIDWSKTTFVEGFNPFEDKNIIPDGNPFDDWFDQKKPTENDNIYEWNKPSRIDLLDHAKHYFDEQESLKKQRMISELYFKPKDHLIEMVNNIYEKEFKNEVVLGVMARGTEYNLHHPMYGIFNVDDYIREIDKILTENTDITKLFIASEDMDYVEKIHKVFPNSFYLKDVFRRTDETMEYINRVHCWCNVSTKRENHCKLLGEEVIIQTKLLGKSDYLFGRLSGVFTGAVLWNDNLKKVFKI